MNTPARVPCPLGHCMFRFRANESRNISVNQSREVGSHLVLLRDFSGDQHGECVFNGRGLFLEN
jgi:hypothetical protein